MTDRTGSTDRRTNARRGLVVFGLVATAFLVLAGQIVRLGVEGGDTGSRGLRLASLETINATWSRPDVYDRHGRLLATDIEVHSLFADPAQIFDRDEVVEKLTALLPDLDGAGIRASLQDRSKRFVWLRRGLTPRLAQVVHDLGIPGLGFRRELLRAYPAGPFAGHVLGGVSIDNRGVGGIETFIDQQNLSDRVTGPFRSQRAPVRLSLDTAAQYAVQQELAQAMVRYQATGAQAVVMDVGTGEVLASVSFPAIEPGRLEDLADGQRPDRVTGSVYELGSVLKVFTLAMGFESGRIKPDTMIDVRLPIEIGRFTIKDPHPAGRALSAREVFVQSSNVGSAKIALDLGPHHQRAFLNRLGLLEPLATELGPVTPPLQPKHWGEIETATVAYGYGVALAPIQFAAGFATLINGGYRVKPSFLKQGPTRAANAPQTPVIAADTVGRMRALLRLNVSHPQGTGRRADVLGYRIGGKTGTAEIAHRGGYAKKSLITTFASAFPMDQPRYVLIVSLFEPKPTLETRGVGTAGVNAAPTAGRIVQRIAPLLGVARRVEGLAP